MKLLQVTIIGVSLIIAALIFGTYLYQSRTSNDSISVVGSATRRFESDIVKWRVTLGRNATVADVNQGYKLIQNDLQTLRQLLNQQGFQENEISVQPVNTYPDHNREGVLSGYRLQQVVSLVSAKIDEVEKMALNPVALTDKGVVLEGSNLEYLFSKLPEIKMSLIADATKDALKRAAEMAANCGVSLGSATSLRTGVFQINEPYSTEVSDYGMYSTQTRQKDVTVTVRASFKVKT